MEGAPAPSKQGVLSHLENLEAHAHKAGLKQGETREHQENAVRLKMRIQELRCQRDELRAKLNMCRSQGSLSSPVLASAPPQRGRRSAAAAATAMGEKEIPGKRPPAPSPLQLTRSKNTTKSGPQTSQATETSKQALLEWKMENVKGLLRVFHLTGLSGKLTKQGACLCISTAFEGTYLDSYCLDLLLQQPVRIQRHSVPAFIPLEQIAQKYLQADIKRFCSVLSDHLNAFAGRKFQADQLQEGFATFLEGPLQGNSLYNLLEFNYNLEGEGRTFLFTAKLVYGDPVRILPTEATVTCKETDDAPGAVSEIAAAHMALFREKPLHEAFSSITDSTANLSQAVSLTSQPPPSL